MQTRLYFNLKQTSRIPLIKQYNTSSLSSVSVTITSYNEIKSGPGLLKLNNSLISDENFAEKLKIVIENQKEDINSENYFN